MDNTLKDFKNNVESIVTLVENGKIKNTEGYAMIVISLLSDNDKGLCIASNKLMAKKLGVSTDRASKLINTLNKKSLITMTTYPKGKSISINDKNYNIYRTVSVNKGIGKNTDRGIGKNTDTPSVKITTKSTNNKSTNNKPTNNLSKENSVKKTKDTEKSSNAKSTVRDSEYNKMLQFAIEQTKQRKNVGSINAYARMVVKNWFKNGLTSLEAVKNSMSKPTQPHFEEKLPEWTKTMTTNNVQPNNSENKGQTMSDIQELMSKINQKTKAAAMV